MRRSHRHEPWLIGPRVGALCGAGLLLAFSGCTNDGSTNGPAKPDAQASLSDGGLPLYAPCTQDADCKSGLCKALLGTLRCTRSCQSSAECPTLAGWRCDPVAGCTCGPPALPPKTDCVADANCDGQPDRAPSTEVCNNIDDDCDGEVDDVAPDTAQATKYFFDKDQDGYGGGEIRWLCAPRAGWTTAGGDCDDQNPAVNPGMYELCGDGLDSDCDGHKEDADVCGRVPLVVDNVAGSIEGSSHKQCPSNSARPGDADLTEIVAKQDVTSLKFSLRLRGAPAATGTRCVAYALHLGAPAPAPSKEQPSPQPTYTLAYVFRPNATACNSLPRLEVFDDGKPMTPASTVEPSASATSPGHVGFVLAKSEIYPRLPAPTYALRACVIDGGNLGGVPLTCTTDTCEVPMHR